MTIKFLDSGREPQCAPDPRFPNGMDIVEAIGARLPHPEGAKAAERLKGWGCTFDLPYPSPRCGLLVVTCDLCGKRVALTVAGRPDDPRWLRMSCNKGPLK